MLVVQTLTIALTSWLGAHTLTLVHHQVLDSSVVEISLLMNVTIELMLEISASVKPSDISGGSISLDSIKALILMVFAICRF